MKKFLAFATTLLLVFLTSTPSSGLGWTFPSPNSVPDGTTLVAVNEPNVFDAWNAWEATTGDRTSYTSHLCPNGVDTLNCDPSKANVRAHSILSVCTGTDDLGCVESLRAQVSGSPWVEASFSRGVESQKYEAKSQGAVSAGEISLWQLPGIEHSGGLTSYAVVVKLQQDYNKTTQRFEATALSANVSPFSTRLGGSVPLPEEGNANGQTRVFTRHDPACIWEDSSGCGLLEDFPPNTRIELKIRAPKTITGWFRGRLQTPDIRISEFSSSSNTIAVTGLAVEVPRISILAKRAETPASVAEIIAATGGKNALGPLFTGQSIRDFFSNEGERLFEVMEGLRSTAKDSAQGYSTLWNFTTIDSKLSTPCFANKSEVLGIVTTNASAYLGDPPKFENGFLSYKVAGMHHGPDGKSLNLGTYDLIMSSSVARCLYGFSNAPVQASIQVVNENGVSTVATTQVSERDGWLKLAAYGFTFSEKNIQVKLSQFEPKTITLAKFNGKTIRLNNAQGLALRNFATQASGATNAACTGLFVKSSERSLALSRAKEVCRVLSVTRPELAITASVKQTKLASSNQRVSVGLK